VESILFKKSAANSTKTQEKFEKFVIFVAENLSR